MVRLFAAVMWVATAVRVDSSAPTIVTPMPQCFERGSDGAPVVHLSASSNVSGSTEFARSWVLKDLRQICSASNTTLTTSSQSILLGLATDAAMAAELQVRQLHVRADLGDEGYVLDVRSGRPILVAALTDAGIFRGIQTLRQLMSSTGNGCGVAAATIEDWPDTAYRGIYMYGGWYDSDNTTFLPFIIDQMARHKMSYGIFDGDGGQHFFQAYADQSGTLAQNYSLWHRTMKERFLEFVPNLACGSGGVSDIVDANIAEGLWIKNASFVVNGKGEIVPANTEPAVVGPPNSNFSRGLENWTIKLHSESTATNTNANTNTSTSTSTSTSTNNRASTSTSASSGGQATSSPQLPPPCIYNATFGPPNSGGLGSAQCTVTSAMPAAPHTLTLGIASETFPVVAGGVYAWHAQVRAIGFTGTQGAVDYGIEVLVVQNDCNITEDAHCGASLPYGRFSLQKWVTLSGTFLADERSDGNVYVQAWVDGNYTGTFFLADVKIVQLNTAMLNVVRTSLTDVNVTSANGAVQYVNGVDYTVSNPKRKNVAGDQDLVAVFEEGGNEYVVQAALGGISSGSETGRHHAGGQPLSTPSLKPGDAVLVSYDMLGGMVGQVGDGSHVNSYAEPLFRQNMDALVGWVMESWNVSKIFFGFDELHGINRDSRSRRYGRSNAEHLTFAINTLQTIMTTHDENSRAMFWADALNPWHNGARPTYQEISGGIAGPTYTAATAATWDKQIIHIPWWYAAYEDSPIVNCSEPNVAKGCPMQCDNVKCAMDNTASFYNGVQRDWIAGTGQKEDNIQTWARLQKGQSRALGTLAVQWREPEPDFSGLPFAAEYGWNQAQHQKTTGCAAP